MATTVVVISAVPAASPSSPSIKLNAFVMPTIQRMVSGSDHPPRTTASETNGSPRTSIRNPENQTTIAAMIWKVNFHWYDTERMSSTRPRMSTAPAAIERTYQ